MGSGAHDVCIGETKADNTGQCETPSEMSPVTCPEKKAHTQKKLFFHKSKNNFKL
jgi:hypothetical protein